MVAGYLGAGLAQGAADVAKYAQEFPIYQAQVQEAKDRAEMSQFQLEEYKINSPLRQGEADMHYKQLEAQTRQLQAQSAKQIVYDSFRMYKSTGNTEQLNMAIQNLRNNPVGQGLLGNAVRVDPITEADAPLLKKAGFQDVNGILNSELKKDLVKFTDSSGQQHLADMNQLYAGTGFSQYEESSQLDMDAKRALMLKRLQGGSTVNKESAIERVVTALREENPDLSYSEAYAIAKNPNAAKGGDKSVLERTATTIQQQDPTIDRLTALNQAAQTTSPTGKQKDFAAADEAKDAIDQITGGNYFQSDLSDPALRRKVEPYVRQIEQFTGAEMSTAQKKRVTELRQLITLGKAGAEMTDAETGPLDSMLRETKKYISNDIQGIDATAAYEAYRNLIRNALFGASLTNNETVAFNKAFGTLGEQAGPVLAKLRTQTQMLADELGAIYDSGDEYVMKYRLGMDQDKLVQVLNTLDQRLELFDNMAPEGTEVMVPTTPPAVQPKDETPEQRKARLQEMLK